MSGASVHRSKQVTTSLSEVTYLRLLSAKVWSRKPFKFLIAEGCELVAAQLRLAREHERILQAASDISEGQEPALGAYIKVTGELKSEAYLALVAASHFSGRSIRELAAEGCRLIGDHYANQRKGKAA